MWPAWGESSWEGSAATRRMEERRAAVSNLRGPAPSAQDFRQLLYGVPVRPPPLPALEQADGLRCEACPCSQGLLGKVGRVAVAPE